MTKLGFKLLRLESVSSTNDVARDLALLGAEEGLAVVARHQTAGRGRQGRSWSSPRDQGLYLSVVLRPKMRPSDSLLISLGAAVAVAETISDQFRLSVDIKWPNDILIRGRKVCGILVESAIEGERLEYAILGVGLNLAQVDFPPEIRDIATSLFIEYGRQVSVDQILPPLLGSLDRWYRLVVSDPNSVILRWEELSSYARGCLVSVRSAEGSFQGITRGLTPRGSLLLEVGSSELCEIYSGEVSLRKV
jgi:BirA family biotin operon repressor/biotin-[acetyl-CoA-carboxylase] ligase